MTSEQKKLLAKAFENLQAARLLQQEGYQTIAVTRAYYVMFYVAQALLIGQGLSFGKHSAVIAAFGKEFIKTEVAPIELHRYLIEGFEARQVADYRILPFNDEEVIRHIQQAERFLFFGQSFLETDSARS